MTSGHDYGTPWRGRLVSRSMSSQRERASDEVGRVLAAATELLAEVAAHFTIDDVVRRSHVSRRRFYEIFPTKDDLALTVIAQRAAQAVAACRATISESDDPEVRFWAALRRLVDTESQGPARLVEGIALLRTQLAASRRGDLDRAERATTELLTDLVGECQAGGLVARARHATAVADLAALLIREEITRRALRRVGAQPSDAPDAPAGAHGDDDVFDFVSYAVFGHPPQR